MTDEDILEEAFIRAAMKDYNGYAENCPYPQDDVVDLWKSQEEPQRIVASFLREMNSMGFDFGCNWLPFWSAPEVHEKKILAYGPCYGICIAQCYNDGSNQVWFDGPLIIESDSLTHWSPLPNEPRTESTK